jgi:hypothetical protein
MHLPTFLKYLAVAWGVPVAILLVVILSTPGPNQNRSDFQKKTFTPARIWVSGIRGTKGSDYFELRIQSPEGDVFFHRDPDRKPISDLEHKLPKDSEVDVLYASTGEGNIVMEITSGSAPSSPPVLSFESVMAEYGARRKLVYIVAAIWWVLANLLSYALWKVPLPQTKALNDLPTP